MNSNPSAPSTAKLRPQLSLEFLEQMPRAWREFLAYVFAGVVTALTLAVRLIAGESGTDDLGLEIFLIPVVLSAYCGGVGPGLMAMGLSGAIAHWVLGSGAHPFWEMSGLEVIEWMILFAGGSLIIWLLHRLRRSQQLLRVSEQRCAAIIGTAMDAIVTVDEQHRITGFNAAAEMIFGLPKSAMLGQSLERLLPERLRDGHASRVRELGAAQVLERMSGQSRSGFGRRANGEEFPIEASMSQAEVAGGRIFTAIIRDVTERKRAEEALRETERTLRLFIDYAPAAIAMFDRDMRYLFASRRWTSDYRLGSADVIGRSHYEIFPEIPERWKVIHRLCLGGAIERCDEDPFPRTDGTVDWVTWEIRPWHDATGAVGGLIIMSEVVTARRQAAEALRESESRFRHLAESLPQLVWTCRPDGACDYLSPQWLAFTGTTESSQRDFGWLEQLHPDDREAVKTTWLAAAEQGRVFATEFRIRRYDGVYRWFDTRGVPMRDARGGIVKWFGTNTDITERRQAAEAWRESEERMRALVTLLPDALFINQDDKIVFANPRALQLWRAERSEQILGHSPFDFIHPDEHAQVRERIHRVYSEASIAPIWETRMVALDGTVVPVETTGVSLIYDGRPAIQVVVRDITERKQLQAQLLRSQRLDSVGRLAGGIAHDLNNILSPVLLGASILRSNVSGRDAHVMLDTIEESARRGAAIIKQLLTFSRGVEGARIAVPLQRVVQEMTNLMRETFPRNIAVRFEASTEPFVVNGDATQLHQVLMNLCVNARDAMPEGGAITIALAPANVDDAFARMMPEARPGSYIVLSVQDTGTGIAPEMLDKIFDPFFTTKEVGQGTGLGLSTVLGIVKGHGGFVQVNSRVGEGTQFRVFLPTGQETSAAAAAPPVSPNVPQGHGEQVLLVDDETALRRVIRQALQVAGYRVLEAGDGADGIARFVEHRHTVRVVITDIMMPTLDGVGLTRALRDLDATVPVIAVTGVSHTPKIDELRTLGVSLFLTKPFTADTLLQLVHAALASHAE